MTKYLLVAAACLALGAAGGTALGAFAESTAPKDAPPPVVAAQACAPPEEAQETASIYAQLLMEANGRVAQANVRASELTRRLQETRISAAPRPAAAAAAPAKPAPGRTLRPPAVAGPSSDPVHAGAS